MCSRNILSNLVNDGRTLSSADDLNTILLTSKGFITLNAISGVDLPKNSPNGASDTGVVITIRTVRRTQIYFDKNFSKTRIVYSNDSKISDWV